ncbi:MAG: long-chain acyl-CoA synthetase [Rhodospirillaceae bacterium]|nr:long-chain acyl-CoA synthetase [Rhodospirillaceae bacterium]
MQQAAASETRAFPWLKVYPRDVNWGAAIGVKPMSSLLDDAVARFADRPCIDFLGKHYSYAEVGRLVDRAAKGLKQLGVGPGIKVGLCLPNSPYAVICYYAVLKAGGTLVNFNPLYAERELKLLIEDSDTDIMVTLDLAFLHGKLAALIGHTRLKRLIVCRMADALPFPRNWLYPWVMRHEVARIPADAAHVTFEALIDNDGAIVVDLVDPYQAVALLQYTGGTTGLPKAAMLTHANLYANAEQCARWFAQMPGPKRILGVLPLFHVFAMTVVMNWALHEGGEMILLPRFQIDDLLKAIARTRPTAMAGVPTLFNAMINAPNLGKHDLSALRFCVSGGAALPQSLRLEFERVTGARLIEGYGLSECSPVVCVNPVSGEGPSGSIGLPYPGTVVEILSIDPPRRILEPGETGEICVSGPQVMAGYWKRPEDTAAVMIDGRLATGDVGHMDADGYVFVTDRLKDMINASGFKIYPRNVEEAILLHPAVLECAVVGMPDAYRGQTVKAFVALKPGASLTAAGLSEFLGDKLSTIEMPKLIEFRTSLPKTTIGKISKKALLEEGQSA